MFCIDVWVDFPAFSPYRALGHYTDKRRINACHVRWKSAPMSLIFLTALPKSVRQVRVRHMGCREQKEGLMGFIKLVVFGFIGLTVIYLSISLFSRSVRKIVAICPCSMLLTPASREWTTASLLIAWVKT